MKKFLYVGVIAFVGVIMSICISCNSNSGDNDFDAETFTVLATYHRANANDNYFTLEALNKTLYGVNFTPSSISEGQRVKLTYTTTNGTKDGYDQVVTVNSYDTIWTKVAKSGTISDDSLIKTVPMLYGTAVDTTNAGIVTGSYITLYLTLPEMSNVSTKLDMFAPSQLNLENSNNVILTLRAVIVPGQTTGYMTTAKFVSFYVSPQMIMKLRDKSVYLRYYNSKTLEIKTVKLVNSGFDM